MGVLYRLRGVALFEAREGEGFDPVAANRLEIQVPEHGQNILRESLHVIFMGRGFAGVLDPVEPRLGIGMEGDAGVLLNPQ